MRDFLVTLGIILISISIGIAAAIVVTQLANIVILEKVVEEVTTSVKFEILLVGNKYNKRTKTVELGVVTFPAIILVEEEFLPILMQGNTWGIMTPRELGEGVR